MSIRNAPPLSLADLLISSSSEIPARIAAVVANHDAPPLYSRHWLNYSTPAAASTVEYPFNTPTFRVMQFNLLAEGLSAHPNNTPPFLQDTQGSPIKPSSCGGFECDNSPSRELVFHFHEYRKWRLLEEILRVDPDVLTLEEIDHYPDFFQPLLTSLGYKGLFQPKKDSPSTQFGYYSDGVAVFWKDSGEQGQCSRDNFTVYCDILCPVKAFMLHSPGSEMFSPLARSHSCSQYFLTRHLRPSVQTRHRRA
jgi:hypothetical protein